MVKRNAKNFINSLYSLLDHVAGSIHTRVIPFRQNRLRIFGLRWDGKRTFPSITSLRLHYRGTILGCRKDGYNGLFC